MSMRVIELLGEGDWACADGDADALARTCSSLAEIMDDEHVERLREVADWLARDMHIAVRRWAEFAGRVRHPAGRRLLGAGSRRARGEERSDDISSAAS